MASVIIHQNAKKTLIRDLVMFCHTPLFVKAKKQGEMLLYILSPILEWNMTEYRGFGAEHLTV